MNKTIARALAFTLTLSCIPLAVQAQSKNMADPDILGIRIGMTKDAVNNLLKANFPTAKIAPVKKFVHLDNWELPYDGQLQITFGKLKPSTSKDEMVISFLPDEKVVAVKRTIQYHEGKQKPEEVMFTLDQKFGGLVYHAHDDKSVFADQGLWSDILPPGLSMIGATYQQGIMPRSDNFTAIPYLYCKVQMESYTLDQFSPMDLYVNMTDKSEINRNAMNSAKMCGKSVFALTKHAYRYPFSAIQTEIYMADLANAPANVLKIPDMAKKNPKIIYATVSKSMPKPSADTPNM
jgi:hypothetical protein